MNARAVFMLGAFVASIALGLGFASWVSSRPAQSPAVASAPPEPAPALPALPALPAAAQLPCEPNVEDIVAWLPSESPATAYRLTTCGRSTPQDVSCTSVADTRGLSYLRCYPTSSRCEEQYRGALALDLVPEPCVALPSFVWCLDLPARRCFRSREDCASWLDANARSQRQRADWGRCTRRQSL